MYFFQSYLLWPYCSVLCIAPGYADTAQTVCLSLLTKKIAVAQSTSGDMPETGLDVLNQDGDSIEVELARRHLPLDAQAAFGRPFF